MISHNYHLSFSLFILLEKMTSLQQQLKRLAVPHVTQALEAKKVSLLFDSKDAASLDASDVLDIALEGLEELIKKNKSLAKYRNLLFNKDTISFNRATCSKEVNQKLDKILLDFLIEISPYFLMRPAQQTLEWLVHRHQINHFNMDDWIMTILPFHNSKIFVKVLTILNLENPTGKWHWLNECAKHGMPLPRVVIVNHCRKDGCFFRFVLSTLSTYIEVLGAGSPALTERIDFCFKIMLELLQNSISITQESVAIILEFLTTGIKSKCLAWEAKCYEYLPRLMATVTLTSDKINHICKVISKRHSEELVKSVVLSLNFLVMVSESEIPEEAFAKFKFSKIKLQKIANLARLFDILPLLKLMKKFDETGVIRSIVEQLDQPEEEAVHEEMEIDEVDQSAVDQVQAGVEKVEEKKEIKIKYKTLSSKNFYEVVSLLASNDHAVRARCMKFLVAKHSQSSVPEQAALLAKIFKKQEEITQDDSALTRVFERFFTSERLKNEKVKKCLDSVVALVMNNENSVETKLALLKCFSQVQLDEVRDNYMKLAEKHTCAYLSDGEGKHLDIIKAILDNVNTFESSVEVYAQMLLQLLVNKDGHGKQLIIVAVESILKFRLSFKIKDNDAILKQLLDISLDQKGLFKTKVFRKLAFREDFLQKELQLARNESEPKLKKMRVGVQNLDMSKTIFLMEIMELPEDADESCKISNLLMILLTRLTKESGSDVEYCRRLILVLMHKIVSSLADMKGMQINVEILVQCLRCTANLQTQKQVLILMTAIAPYYPRDLLYNIVSVFSFMGNEFLQNDDKYSFEILSSLINVIMFSVEQLKDDSAEKTLLEVLRIFVDSRHHIPKHRFGPLIERLLSLDVDQSLWKVIVMIVESCICKREASNDEAEFKQLLNSEHETISLVVSNYPLDTMLTLLVNLIQFLRKMLAEDGTKLEVVNEGLMKQPRLCRLMLYHLSKVVHLLLDRRIFFAQIEDSSQIKTLVQDTVQFMHDIDSKQKSVEKGSTNERFWPSLIKVVQNIFDRMNNFMPSKLFIEVVENLVSADSVHINCKGLELLNVHLIAIEKRGDASSSQSSLGLVPKLIKTINSSTEDEKDSKLDLVSKQLSFLNLKLMMRVYGESHWECFKECYAPIILCLDAEKMTSVALVDSALLCFSDLVNVMKIRLLPHMDQIMTYVINLYGSERILKSGVSLNCLNKALVKLILNLGKFFSRRLAELIVAIGNSMKHDLAVEDFNAIFQALAVNIETRVLVPALESCYVELVKEDLRSVQVAFLIFKHHSKTLTKDCFTLHGDSLQSVVGKFLNVRHDGRKSAGNDFDALDGHLVESVLPLIYLMSEITFKSMFNSYLTLVSKESVVTFFRLMENIAGILRGLFGMFSKSLIPLMTETLKKSGAIFEECSVNIYRLVSMCHVNDRDDAFAMKASEGLYQVLADMMEKTSDGTEDDLIDCFVQMSQSIKDIDVSRALFEKIYEKLRHSSSKVRILALKVVKSVAEILQNVNDVFLQDVCPYIVEIVDDDNETVAKLGREVLGGPLRSILDNDMS